MLEICKKIFSKWNSARIEYCIWKGTYHMDNGLSGDNSDVDVLVSKQCRVIADAILSDNHFIRCNTQFGLRSRDVFDWVGLDELTGKLVHIHLHYRMIAGHYGTFEYDLPWCVCLFENRIFNNEFNIYTIDPATELILLTTRLSLEFGNKKFEKTSNGKVLKNSTQKEFEHLKTVANKQVVENRLLFLFGDSAYCVLEVIYGNGDFKSLKKCCEKAIGYNGCTSYINLKRYYYKLVGIKILPRFSRFANVTRGKTLADVSPLSIAFIGQDGSGKSTITSEIEKWLRWKIDARRFYLGSGEHYISISTRIKRLFKGQNPFSNRKLSGTEIGIGKKKNNTAAPKQLSRSFFKIANGSYNLMTIAKRAYKVVLTARRFSNKGGIALFDRFPQNQFFGIYDGPKIKTNYTDTGRENWFVRIMRMKEEKYINEIQNFQPSLLFKLTLSPEESIRRKPFENYESVKAKSEITRKLVFNNSEVHEIDATLPYEQELLQVKRIIWQHIYKKQKNGKKY